MISKDGSELKLGDTHYVYVISENFQDFQIFKNKITELDLKDPEYTNLLFKYEKNCIDECIVEMEKLKQKLINRFDDQINILKARSYKFR